MKVAILVPRRNGMPDRDRLWAFCRTWWLNDFPEWGIFEGAGPDGDFCRSHAINEAAAKAGDWDVAVIIDADVLINPDSIRAAVALAHTTDQMVLGYHRRALLAPGAVTQILAGRRTDWEELPREAKDRFDACSSAVVVSRPLWEAVGGFDERFVGWGWEDVAFHVACETISGRPMVKIAGTCWHLAHKIAPGNNRRTPTFRANKALFDHYKSAQGSPGAMAELLSESDPEWASDIRPEPTPTHGIPPILHRTVPAEVDIEAEAWWVTFKKHLGSNWQIRTHRDPLEPDEWPETSDLWDRCNTGAQKAGLIRLEAIWKWGGVYVDSDVECLDSLESLLGIDAFVAGWEDRKTIPDAVFAAPAGHPATAELLDAARRSVERGDDPWHSGPGVFTQTLPAAARRGQALLLPPGTFYPYHWKDKERERKKSAAQRKTDQPWALMQHHWKASWLPENQQGEP